MSKKPEQPEVEQTQQTEVPATPIAEETTSKPIDVLREKGKVILYAPTLEKLNQDALELIAEAKAEGNVSAGAAGYNVVKGYTITITLKKEV